MAITYEWSVMGLRRSEEGNVIYVDWKKTGTDENGYTACFTQVEKLDPANPSSDSYIPFDSLTEENVLSWVKSKVVGTYLMDVDHFIQRRIQEQIETIDNISDNLPWAPPEDLPEIVE